MTAPPALSRGRGRTPDVAHKNLAGSMDVGRDPRHIRNMLTPLSTDPAQWQAYIASAFNPADMSRRADEAARAGVDFAALQRAALAATYGRR